MDEIVLTKEEIAKRQKKIAKKSINILKLIITSPTGEC